MTVARPPGPQGHRLAWNLLRTFPLKSPAIKSKGQQVMAGHDSKGEEGQVGRWEDEGGEGKKK